MNFVTNKNAGLSGNGQLPGVVDSSEPLKPEQMRKSNNFQSSHIFKSSGFRNMSKIKAA